MQQTRSISALVAVFVAVALLLVCYGPAGSLQHQEEAEGKDGDLIPGQFIVTFDDDASQDDKNQVKRNFPNSSAARILHEYSSAVRGFTVRFHGDSNAGLAFLQGEKGRKKIKHIEQDRIIRLQTTQIGATWGLDRIDQRIGRDGSFRYTSTGSGVHAYVIDTGIRSDHSEFVGRIGQGFDAVTEGGAAADCNGHGTHVAGTIGGTVYGVAKGVTLHPIRVLNCGGSGTYSGVIAGVDWVARNKILPAVANLSLGGGTSTALDSAIENLISTGVVVTVSAGNSNDNACHYSPARVPAAITVGATDSRDRKASYSNTGSCVDIFAPGSDITSAWYTSTTATNTISGTSMAAPHVAGVAAQYLQLNPNKKPAEVRDALVANATKDIVKSARSKNDCLLFTNY